MRISDWSSDVCSSDLASLPTGLYAIEPEADMRVGDLALVRPTPALEAFMADRHYVERHVPLLKPVAAVAGATVCRAGLHVTIDGHAVVSVLSRDRFGRTLPAWSGSRGPAGNALLPTHPATPSS